MADNPTHDGSTAASEPPTAADHHAAGRVAGVVDTPERLALGHPL